MKTMESCRACHGRLVLPNARTGEPCICPICNGTGKTEPLYDRLPFYYVINEAAIAANARRSNALRIEPRADFEWVWLMATQTGAFQTEFTDASGRTYQNLPVNNLNQWGTAQLPFPLVAPTVLRMRTSVNYTLTDASAAPNTVQLVLSGFELYPLAAAA